MRKIYTLELLHEMENEYNLLTIHYVNNDKFDRKY